MATDPELRWQLLPKEPPDPDRHWESIYWFRTMVLNGQASNLPVRLRAVVEHECRKPEFKEWARRKGIDLSQDEPTQD